MSLIPPITCELGKYWDQPDSGHFLFDDKHVLMSKRDFECLKEYSCSQPSGVYIGKMWKACPSKFFPEAIKGWYLRWYGACEEEGFVSNHQREILLSDS